MLVTFVAVGCSLVAWLGVAVVLAMLGCAAGAFCAAMMCPLIGCEVVLDDLRVDIAKCLGLGAYVVGGAWGMFAALKWLVTQVHGEETPVVISGGLFLVFMFTVGLVSRLLWPDIEKAEATILTVGSFIGTILALVLFG